MRNYLLHTWILIIRRSTNFRDAKGENCLISLVKKLVEIYIIFPVKPLNDFTTLPTKLHSLERITANCLRIFVPVLQ